MAKLYLGNQKIIPSLTRYYITREVINGELSSPSKIIDLRNVKTISDFCLKNAYSGNTLITGNVDFSDVEWIKQQGCYYMFKGCTKLTSVDLSSLTLVESHACDSMFYDCTNITTVDLSNLTEVKTYGCAQMFYGCNKLSGHIDLSKVSILNGERPFYYTFRDCKQIESVDMSSVVSANGSLCFCGLCDGCTNLKMVDFSSLISITDHRCFMDCFYNCTSLISADFSSLASITGSSETCDRMFCKCTSLTSMTFESLRVITGSQACQEMFSGCTSLTNVYFPALTSVSFGTRYTNQFNNMLSGVTGCTIHFPSNLNPSTGSTTISSLSSYPNFGGNSTVLSYDLPATE